MFNITTDIQPLSHFKRNTQEVREHLKATGNPMVLTVNGKAEMVVMDAAAYEGYKEWQIAKALHVSDEDLQEALDEVDAGSGRPAREAIAEIFAKYAL